jgi:hypothetical protein
MAREWHNNLESVRKKDKKKKLPENESCNRAVNDGIDAQFR